MSDTLEKLEKLLTEHKADYAIYTDSRQIRSAQEGAELYNILLSEATPTLILKIQDKYYAAIICGDQRISFEKLKQRFHAQSVSLADPKTVFALTGAKIGSVGLINGNMPTLIDTRVLKNKQCYGGCGIAGKTLRLNTEDLVRITGAEVLDFCL